MMVSGGQSVSQVNKNVMNLRGVIILAKLKSPFFIAIHNNDEEFITWLCIYYHCGRDF